MNSIPDSERAVDASAYRREAETPEIPNGVCSLTDQTLFDLLSEASPSAQATSTPDRNIGFGFLYYSLGRILRPKLAVVLGSKMGFSAVSMALAIRDNLESGELILVDAAYDDNADGADAGMGGVGFWRDGDRVEELLQRFGVADVMTVKIMSTVDFAELHIEQKLPAIDLLLIDADHSYTGFKTDFETYAELVQDAGVILCHDSEVQDGYAGYSFGVGKYLREVVMTSDRFEAMSLPVWPGLGIVRKTGSIGDGGRVAPVVLQRVLQTSHDWLPLPVSQRERLRDAVLRYLRILFPNSY
ncbi:MAG: putative O-methyltransferase YrrM [Hyphomicrobiaceae bacterium]|jgi:predicted O-methyltransferase YrrM